MAQLNGLTRVEAAIRAVLPRSAKIQASASTPKVELHINGTSIRPEWLPQGSLRQVRERLSRMPLPDVLVARRMSPAAREAASASGVGWIDETGAAEIALGPIIVSRSGRADLFERDTRWTPAVLAVAEALLCGSLATVEGVERVTGLSIGACTKALRVLEDLGLVISSARRGRSSARRIPDTNALLDAYAVEAVKFRGRALRVGVAWANIVSGLRVVGHEWTVIGRSWSTTGAAAASVMAPYLSTVTTAEVYVNAKTIAELEAAALEVNLEPLDGGRLLLRPFPTVTTRLLTEEREGIRVSPWPRVYADLRATGVRGEEAAEHLRESVRDN